MGHMPMRISIIMAAYFFMKEGSFLRGWVYHSAEDGALSIKRTGNNNRYFCVLKGKSLAILPENAKKYQSLTHIYAKLPCRFVNDVLHIRKRRKDLFG